MKITRSELKQLILEAMNEADVDVSVGTSTDAVADARVRLDTADGEAVLAANSIIDSLLGAVEKVDLTDLDGDTTESWEVTDEFRAAITTAEARDLPLAGILSYAEYGTMGGNDSAFVTIANFKDSKSQPGQGDKDALAYSNLMAAAMDMEDLADKWGTKVSAFEVTKDAKDLKDAVFAAYNALVKSKPGPAVGSAQALKTVDF